MAFGDVATSADDFNRANVDPINTPWASITGLATNKILTNKFATASAALTGSQLTTYNLQDLEAYGTMTRWGSPWIGFRQTQAGDNATRDGYDVAYNGTSIILYRVDNGTRTQLTFGSLSTAGGAAVGVGISAIGTAIKAYTNVGAGWVLKIDTTDATYNQSGAVLLGMNGDAGGQWDDLFIGNLAAGGFSPAIHGGSR